MQYYITTITISYIVKSFCVILPPSVGYWYYQWIITLGINCNKCVGEGQGVDIHINRASNSNLDIHWLHVL
ncbi:hypothetical protein LOTGIDRAFT_215980 [Lottia gigantea]|uniref:Uncharacterized protein n=1 Tax=Lottia gigantea TaxID=225164 RepID=V4AJ78_LOTGI|nr:hypothetical protein LOTGIDRAFT_215980 [Lottia gigantea]ESO93596.1 hypothetical protein LOTGIDRAFT_215980 [Lottia gigantea]